MMDADQDYGASALDLDEAEQSGTRLPPRSDAFAQYRQDRPEFDSELDRLDGEPHEARPTQERGAEDPLYEPWSIEETGLGERMLLDLMLKAFYIEGLETPVELGETLTLSRGVIKELLWIAKQQRLIETYGGGDYTEDGKQRFGLTSEGKNWALEALSTSLYVGPAPVPFETYCRQVAKQSIKAESVDQDRLDKALSHLILPDLLKRRLGPALNSGRALLLYGPPGNGKTSIAETIGDIFAQTVWLPHCVEIGGKIMKLFDPALHDTVDDVEEERQASGRGRDQRWVPCRRPIIIVGGEMTLDMVELNYNRELGFYEAPLHVKAIGGTFVVDDLGRQQITPDQLLNRWIVPMEKHIDFLNLHSGKKITVPFDLVLVFSTNQTPEDLMDPAFLRRIPFKIEISYPSMKEFSDIFAMVCRNAELPVDDDIIDYAARRIQNAYQMPLASYQPKFIVDQVIAACRFKGEPVAFQKALVDDALENLGTRAAVE